MPTSRSRSRSYSPPVKRKKHHHKKKSRSPSPDDAHPTGRHNHHRKDHSKQKNDETDREEKKREDPHHHHKHHRSSNDDELSSRRIKTEPEDRGYDQHDKRGAQHRDHNREREHHHHHSDRHHGNERDHRNNSREHYDRRRQDDHRRKMRNVKSEPGADDKQQWGKKGENSRNNQDDNTVEKEKPNFGLSGKLTEDTNTFRGVVIKYNEPPEARKPKKKWRWYPFKGEETLPVLHLHRQSAFLLGRDRKVADIPTDHPSCSKQHAVLQFRMVEFRREDGSTGRRVRPYIIDLGSANGTYLNNDRIEAEKYFELKEKDVVKFGFSSREYVLLHDATDTTVVEDEDSSE